MKQISSILIVFLSLSLFGCFSPTKIVIEHREIPSSLPTGSILRIPKKIAYLDEGKVPPEVLALAIQYQKISETGKWRDLIPLEFPNESKDPNIIAERINELISQESEVEPALAILEAIRYLADPLSAKDRSENWVFNFEIVGYRNRGSNNITFNRTGNEKFRLLNARN